MRLTDDADEVAARIADWTVDVIRDLREAQARGPGAIVQIGDELLEVIEGGGLRLAMESRRRGPQHGTSLAKALK